MAELADALDLGSSEATRTGSIPARCTKQNEIAPKNWTKPVQCLGGFFNKQQCNMTVCHIKLLTI